MICLRWTVFLIGSEVRPEFLLREFLSNLSHSVTLLRLVKCVGCAKIL